MCELDVIVCGSCQKPYAPLLLDKCHEQIEAMEWAERIAAEHSAELLPYDGTESVVCPRCPGHDLVSVVLVGPSDTGSALQGLP